MAERRRHYHSAPKVDMTPEWKDAVRDAMTRRGVTQSELEQRIGAGPGSISKMLSPEQKASGLVSAVTQELGISLPMPISDDERQIILDRRELSPELRAMMDSVIAMHRAKAKPGA